MVPPYDVVAVAPDAWDPGHTHVTYYPGLHRLDPTLAVNVTRGPLGGGTIVGTLSGPGYPQPAGQRTWVGAGAPGAGSNDSFAVYDTGEYSTGTGMFQFCWDTSVHADVRALQARVDVHGLPALYTAAGGSPTGVDLVNGGYATADFALTALAPADTLTLTGSVARAGEVPPTPRTVWVGARFGQVPIPLLAETTTSMSYKVPAVADAIELHADDFSGGGHSVAFRRVAPADLAAGPVDLVIPGLPAHNLPPMNATGIDLATQAFSWYEMTDRPRVIVLTFQMGTFELEYLTAFRTPPQVVLPDPRPLGMAYPRSAWVSWSVFGTTAVASLEQAAGPDGWMAILLPKINWSIVADWYAPSNDYVSAQTLTIPFQTAP